MTDQFLALGASAAIILVILSGFLFFLAALISMLRSPLTGGMVLVWIIFAFCAPFLGPVLWFLIGRRNARSYPAHH
ncbi:PLDc N-terminal domain-containing protein [Crossiella sp. CA-258035]|uniref:PLDc N-terminal domain-containing protein n=1 Tax=Crossiella sp. CA-258035 TaxID=2981138 RepID=UPI0024BD0028|nr:PLDc N-terminal domain-containing protein [Crossiella sp. CA-258035]WHT23090.1 PLDc N-terminal domain-containing protein [Crossiella sp. CA-258035]